MSASVLSVMLTLIFACVEGLELAYRAPFPDQRRSLPQDPVPVCQFLPSLYPPSCSSSHRNEYDRTIQETEQAYMKILESSQTLLRVLRREAVGLQQVFLFFFLNSFSLSFCLYRPKNQRHRLRIIEDVKRGRERSERTHTHTHIHFPFFELLLITSKFRSFSLPCPPSCKSPLKLLSISLSSLSLSLS